MKIPEEKRSSGQKRAAGDLGKLIAGKNVDT
jgi:hypothetical protein